MTCMMNAGNNCITPTVALLNANADRLPCFDDALSEEECVDLYTFALFGGKVEDRKLLKLMSSEQKNIYKVLLERQRSALSLQSTYGDYSYSNETYNVTYPSVAPRRFDINDFLQKLDVKITINETLAQEFLQDLQELQMEYETMRRQNQLEAREFIKEKYAETCAKVNMEWANLVRPVADDYVEYLVAVA